MQPFSRSVINDLTLVTAVDSEYIAKLRLTWPTWMALRPQLRFVPAIVIFDARMSLDCADLDFLADHPNLRLVPWDMEGASSQRERMLSSFVYVPAREVVTSWYLKLDADTYAATNGEWLLEEWFTPPGQAGPPAYVASPWGYTKPADAITKLDCWGDTVEELRGFPPLNLPVKPASDLVRHSRMASWVFFGQTEWTRRVSKFAPHRLPCPSQDTYLWYCAARLGSPVRHIRMSECGWAHCSRFRRLTEACDRVMSGSMKT